MEGRKKDIKKEAPQVRQRGGKSQQRKVGRQEAACDNLVEETGLCAQHCLETKNIFYWGGFGLDYPG